jgi:hypothetical protein
MSVTVDFLSGLYNKHSCYADRLTLEQLEAIHVPTSLEQAVRRWILKRNDVVIVGNPGDGKTHLFKRLAPELEKVKAAVVLDATAESDYEGIVRRWTSARRRKHPFCLAINQGPLNQLVTQHAGRMDVIEEVQRQMGRQLYYDAPPKQPKEVFVVDLNLRSVLTRDIIDRALNNLLKEEHFESCSECFGDETTDGALNQRALQHAQVRGRLQQLLVTAGHMGRHVTMRDLQGFLSYLIFGGRTCAEMVREPSSLLYRYFNLCFAGEGDLFDAIRDVFDPLRATVPSVDEDLWENTGVQEGWIFSRPPLTPDHYEDAWDQFVALKRQYFFEHEGGDALLSFVEEDDRTFLDLLQADEASTDRFLPRVLQAINSFYCPELTEDGQALRLWGAQQYDEHSPKVLVSCYRILRDKFSLRLPKLAPWLAGVMEYQPDHLLLAYTGKSSTAIGLRVDRGLWRALMLASRGIPLGLRSPQYARSLQAFMTRLHRLEAKASALETAIIFNMARNQRMQVVVDRKKGRYVQS